MKKIILFLLPLFFLTSCNNRVFTGKQAFYFSNNSTKDVYLNVSSEDDVFIAVDDTKYIEAYADTNFSIDSCYRCNIKQTAVGKYSIIDSLGHNVTVYNNSARTIILYEKNNYIGSYSDLLAETSETKPLSNVKIEIEIPAGETKTFEVYTNYPKYNAYFKDNNMTADLSLLSFR